MMPLCLDKKVLKLEGLSLTGFLNLYNPNQTLAISYHIVEMEESQNSSTSTSTPELLEIFPSRGTLLRGESEQVVFKMRETGETEITDEIMERELNLMIRFSYKNEYNRILLRSGMLNEITSGELAALGSEIVVPVEIGMKGSLCRSHSKEEDDSILKS